MASLLNVNYYYRSPYSLQVHLLLNISDDMDTYTRLALNRPTVSAIAAKPDNAIAQLL